MKNDRRHWILTALLLSTTSTALAYPSASPFCGFYLGGSVGGAFLSARENRTSSVALDYNGDVIRAPNVFNAAASHTVSHAQRKNSYDIGVYTGYGYAWEDAYLGVEAFLHNTHYESKGKHNFSATTNSTLAIITAPFPIATLSASVSNNTLIRTRLSPTEPGIDIRPGMFLTQGTLLYGRLGVGYNKLTLHADTHPSTLFSYTPVILPIQNDGREDGSRRKKVGALRLGIGLEQNLCDNIYIRADYVNTHYRGTKVRTPVESYTVTTLAGDTLSYTASTTARVSSFFNNTVTLGMSYYW
jgi:opacity protein-like surface antigen